MTTDRELLRSYATAGVEDAFTEIVRRHVDLVYGTALRQLCGNTALAQDVTQAVFTALAARASAHPGIRRLSAWLFVTTRFTVAHTVRTERRRQEREQKAQSMHALLGDGGPEDPMDIPPKLIDAVLEKLDESDREAVLLRFLEGQSFSSIGVTMEMTEDAARMRVTRALERIRTLFAKNGITSAATAVGAALASKVVAAPAGLAAGVSASALAGSAALAAASGAKLGFLSFMTTTKATAWLAATVAAFALGFSAYRYHAAAIREEGNTRFAQEQARLREALDRGERRSSSSLVAQPAEALSSGPKRGGKDRLATANLPAGRTPAQDDEERASAARRMVQMRPLLAGGMPIKGAVIVLVDGKPVQRQVQFVMGKETRVDAVDDGTYVITPALNEDGSVKYAITLLKKDPGGGPDQVEALMAVTQTPWEGFSWGNTETGKVMAFDPDGSGP